ncbi:TonB-dependent receptor [Sphingomonas hengshuiensis]|uniref:TonB-dependent receptor n=1 Tax=Sphingomonas hengshuiensis TaxID=1609977 RepID=A0A7U5BEG2_9SPHN|nr:TonB-dependent receptor [Sphingomonas hengshuiensis]AJP70778.1 hypothetical protein TS85_01495 [Sphingomonas hengshuiensis]
MRSTFFTGVALAALTIPVCAHAQSTGTLDIESNDIVVTAGSPTKSLGGFEQAETTKTRATLNQEFIAKQRPGQSVFELINQLPGVSVQNSDPFGAANATMSIRGFDSGRISLTVDGIPLNDTGNYAVYGAQQLDSELIEQVSVNLGSTDVDSPTAAASGPTLNYRLMSPTEEFGGRVAATVGRFNMHRFFGQINTGNLTASGTRLWLAASTVSYDPFTNDWGKTERTQFNGKIYQPLGSNGDFISIAGTHSRYRNNQPASVPLRTDAVAYSVTGSSPNQTLVTTSRAFGSASANRFPTGFDQLPLSIARCTTPEGTAGVADDVNGCGTAGAYSFNPADTRNIRINSRFTLARGLVLTVDPSFQSIKMNGGGTVTAREGVRIVNGKTYTGYIDGQFYGGRDLNGDGDVLDTCSPLGAACAASNTKGVTMLSPGQARTNRFGVIASLRYTIDENNTVRLGYSWDYGRQRQTGELAPLNRDGTPVMVFPMDSPTEALSGYVLQSRDRRSFATLHQVSAEYIGRFADDRLVINAGLRSPWFIRDLTNYCFTRTATGGVNCLGRDNAAANSDYASQNSYSFNGGTNTVAGQAAPQSRTYRYHEFLPSAGFVFRLDDRFVVHANYSRGLQVPSVSNLYNSFYYPQSVQSTRPVPETSNNFDAGLRYATRNLKIEISPWYTRYQNRLASAFDPVLDVTVFRNLGDVEKYGIDFQVDARPIPGLGLHAFASYLKSTILDDVQSGTTIVNGVATPVYAATKGKRESGFPTGTLGGRVDYTTGPVMVGVQAKYTGGRYVNDQNRPITASYTLNGQNVSYQVYGAQTPSYTLVDIDAKVSLEKLGLKRGTYLQINVTNLFNKFYVGGFGGGSLSADNVPSANIGVPRTFTATLNAAF